MIMVQLELGRLPDFLFFFLEGGIAEKLFLGLIEPLHRDVPRGLFSRS